MDKQRKKQLRNYVTYALIALVVLGLTVMPLIAEENAVEDGPHASILSANVERADISTRLIGGGRLSSNSTNEITIPAEVKLTEYLVGNGDVLKAGDPIAAVDKVSVLSAMASVQETMDYLSGKLATAANSTDPDKVTAHAGGLVKVIYAQTGDSVREVMLEHGALAVLSLDGRMAVSLDLETELSLGTAVTVSFPDGEEVQGRVESSAAGNLTVSLKDEDYTIGQTVTLKTGDGKTLGSGALYIHSAWNATAYSGTVTKVNVKEGDTLSAGKTIFELETGDYSAQFQILNAQRQEYEELMQELFQMYDSGVITAPCDGIVTGVDTDGSFLLASENSGDWQVQLLSNTAPAYTVLRLSQVSESQPEEPGTPDAPSEPGEGEQPPETTQPGTEETQPTEPAPVTYTVRVGQVMENGQVMVNPFTYSDVSDLNGIPTTVSPSQMLESWPLTGLYNKDLTTPYEGTATAGNILFQVTPSTGGTYYVFAGVASPQQPGLDMELDMSAMAGMMGGFMGGMGTTPVFEPYPLDTLTIATVTSQEEMTLEITVDELDFARLYTGQPATITVEALTGQTFPATITAIGNTGTNGGGSSKFTATLTLDQSGDMIPGMSASAFLTLDTTENVLTVPVAALAEENGKTLVYTGYNEKNEVLTDPVEVTTGISDGELVEITSGLSGGETVYYAYYDTLEISNVPDKGFGF